MIAKPRYVKGERSKACYSMLHTRDVEIFFFFFLQRFVSVLCIWRQIHVGKKMPDRFYFFLKPCGNTA